MLAADGLLESLSKDVNTEVFKDNNGDHDLGDVLQFFSSGIPKTHGNTLRYSDGQEKAFSFDQ